MKNRFLVTIETLGSALEHLSKNDPDLGRVVSELGAPPLWARKPGFPTLMHIILGQQVSLASAKATYLKLSDAISPLTPQRFLTLSDSKLKEIGFSRQKTLYCRELASAILEKRLDLKALHNRDDAAVHSDLTQIKGIGPWTAEIYLLMALRRPDIWPSGDLALAIAAQSVKNLRTMPSHNQLERLGERWRPWRSVAARILWHHYLSERNQKLSM
ncbi:DNA-3-methyladenine glycosylase 2 family protein [Candidatus Acetothermia bacterium]|nr:DNA-3-methyladenine glycosylase 2 family protein [Candidatus Acetothermia bacterium]MBI3642481.1 DNA-3-methyladenine glycosylase 2 family protein [Candidatus Acetothermia bacterium]